MASQIEEKAKAVAQLFEDKIYGKVKGLDSTKPLDTYKNLTEAQKSAVYGANEDVLPAQDSGALDYWRRASTNKDAKDAMAKELAINFKDDVAGLEKMLNGLQGVSDLIDKGKSVPTNLKEGTNNKGKPVENDGNTQKTKNTQSVDSFKTEEITGANGQKFKLPIDVKTQYEQLIATMQGIIPDNSHGMISAFSGNKLTIQIPADKGRKILDNDQALAKKYGFKAKDVDNTSTSLELEYFPNLATSDKNKPEAVNTRAFDQLKTVGANFGYQINQGGLKVLPESKGDTLVVEDTHGLLKDVTKEKWAESGFKVEVSGNKFTLTFHSAKEKVTTGHHSGHALNVEASNAYNKLVDNTLNNFEEAPKVLGTNNDNQVVIEDAGGGWLERLKTNGKTLGIKVEQVAKTNRVKLTYEKK